MRNPAFKHKGIKKKATSYEQSGESIIFTLYHTPIVIVRPHEIVLNSGGYKTVTTKRRMNEISKEFDLGYQVYSSKKRWAVSFGRFTDFFSDGMVIPRYL